MDYKTHIYVGVIGSVLLDGANPATIALVDSNVTDLTFNRERAGCRG